MGKASSIIQRTRVFRWKSRDETQMLRVINETGGLWVVGRDIAKLCGYVQYTYVNASIAKLFKFIPKQHKGRKLVNTLAGIQPFFCVSEHGLTLFLEKYAHNEFKIWFYTTVLPETKRPKCAEQDYCSSDTLELLKPSLKKDVIGHIYVLYDKERKICKIGRSDDPRKRIQGIVNGSGILEYASFVSKELKNTDTVEKIIHEKFNGQRIGNTEWFQYELIDIVQKIKKLINMAGRPNNN